MDNSVEKKVVAYLKHLGLDAEGAAVYIFLLQQGPQTVLGISRGLKTGRTKLYALLETLAAQQLVTVHERHYGTSYEAAPATTLEFLVQAHESQASGLRSELAGVVHALNAAARTSPTTSRVAEYRGADGLKQLYWNVTKSHGEYRAYRLPRLRDRLEKHFLDKLQVAEAGMTALVLVNAAGDAGGKARVVAPSLFKIEFETYIYNNCVALISQDDDRITGVEIYNDKLAQQQRQLFDLLWGQSPANVKAGSNRG